MATVAVAALVATLAPVAEGRIRNGAAPARVPLGDSVVRVLAQLTVDQTVPRAKAAAGASGFFSAVVRARADGTGTMAWQLGFGRLTGPALTVELHVAAIGRTGPTALRVCPPPACRARASGTFTGPIGQGSALLRAIEGGRTYVVVRTKANPKGELRGQVRPTASAAAAGG